MLIRAAADMPLLTRHALLMLLRRFLLLMLSPAAPLLSCRCYAAADTRRYAAMPMFNIMLLLPLPHALMPPRHGHVSL